MSVAGAHLRLSVRADGDRYVLTAEPAGPGLPGWTCGLAGTVVEGSLAARGGSFSCRLRPFGTVAVAGHGPLELSLTLAIDEVPTGGVPDAFGVTVTLRGPSDYPLEAVSVLGALRLNTNAADGDWRFLIPLAEGHLLPASGDLPEQVGFGDSGISLPLVALVPGHASRHGGFLVMAADGDDDAVRPLGSHDGAPGMELVGLASMGRWTHDRTWRLVWVRDAGLVSLAGVVRAELRSAGLRLAGLPDKLDAAGLPQRLQDSVGGTHLWWHLGSIPDTLVADLQRDGIRSVVLLGRVPPGSDVARDAAEAGHVVAPYFQTSDILPPGFGEELEWRGTYPPEGSVHGWPEQLMRTREGLFDPNWQHLPCHEPSPLWTSEEFVDTGGRTSTRPRALRDLVMTQGYRRCARFHVETLRSFGLPLLERDRYTGLFYDVMTAMHATECFSVDHPCDRRADTASRVEALAAVAGSGRFVGSEYGKWWALDTVHALEGLLTYGGADINNRVLADYPFSPAWYDTLFNLELRVPFFGLVARHSVARTLWWGHGQDRHAESWGAKDALCAAFGGNPIFVVDAAHPLTRGTPQWSRFRRTAQAFDVLRARTFGSAIDGYETMGRHVAVTSFADGTVVRANVGPVAAEGLDAGSFEILDDGAVKVGGA